MILDNKEQLIELSPYDDWVIHPLYLDNRYHSAENRISCLYIVNTLAWDSYIIPIEHTEKLGDIELEDVIEYFTENDVNMIIYDKKSALSHMEDWGSLFDLELLYYLNGDEFVFNSPFNGYYHRWDDFEKINTMIPLAILFDRMDKFYIGLEDEFTKLTKYREIKNKTPYKNYDKVIHTLHDVEANGIYKNGNIVYTQYHIYTTTGRPSNSFGGTNYAALNKSDETRKQYTSRYEDGVLYLYDYQAFHPTILSNYLRIQRSEGISMHEHLGCKYFKTNELTEEQYDESKKKTFFYLYGPDEIHEDVKDFKFFQKVARLKKDLERKDIIETPIFKRSMHVEGLEVSKKFNYFLQCFESEINFVKMKKLNKLLEGMKTKMVLYTYDSFLFDVHPDEKDILSDIKKILESGNFPVTVHKGNNYKDMKKIE